MSLLKGIPVTLYERTQTGVDDFNAPVWTETETAVENVLVYPATEQEITDAMNLWGKKAVYTLCIPKGDAHSWMNCRVKFFDMTFRVIGCPIMYIEDMVPLDWNKKVQVETVVGETD